MILLYEFGLLVYFDVILVTIVIFTTFLRPSGIDILVGFLVHLALLFLLGVTFFSIPQVFTIASLDLLVFLLGISKIIYVYLQTNLSKMLYMEKLIIKFPCKVSDK